MITSSSPECRYIVTDSYGRVMLAGQVAIGSDKSFAIDFDGQLPAGHFTLAAEIIVNGKSTMPPFGTVLSKSDIDDLIAYLKKK